MGLEPTTLYTLDRALYQLSYRGSSAGWAQISHLIVHLMDRLTCTCMHNVPAQSRAPRPETSTSCGVYMYSTCTCRFSHHNMKAKSKTMSQSRQCLNHPTGATCTLAGTQTHDHQISMSVFYNVHVQYNVRRICKCNTVCCV